MDFKGEKDQFVFFFLRKKTAPTAIPATATTPMITKISGLASFWGLSVESLEVDSSEEEATGSEPSGVGLAGEDSSGSEGEGRGSASSFFVSF